MPWLLQGGYQLEKRRPLRLGVPCGPFPHRHFAHHFSEDIELEVMATSIGVSAEWLDLCFDHCSGKTPFQALQHFRLSRLFEGIAEHPQSTLQQQVHRCGLASVMAANRLFEEFFGIGLAPFRRVCRRAAADRLLHRARP